MAMFSIWPLTQSVSLTYVEAAEAKAVLITLKLDIFLVLARSRGGKYALDCFFLS